MLLSLSVIQFLERARLPERPKGADCKSAGIAYRSSNLLPSTKTNMRSHHEIYCGGASCCRAFAWIMCANDGL